MKNGNFLKLRHHIIKSIEADKLDADQLTSLIKLIKQVTTSEISILALLPKTEKEETDIKAKYDALLSSGVLTAPKKSTAD